MNLRNVDYSQGQGIQVVRELKSVGQDVETIKEFMEEQKSLKANLKDSPYVEDRVHLQRDRLIDSDREKEWRRVYNSNGTILSY